MIFGRNRIKKLSLNSNQFFFWQRFRKNKLALWSFRVMIVLVFIAYSPILSQMKNPYTARFKEIIYFPVMLDYQISLGIRKPISEFVNKDWYKEEYERVIWPLIPYAATTIDQKNMQFAHPFKKQRVKSWRFRHWLGTNHIGKDIAAGLIAGVRIALSIGIIAMIIASFIGIILGGIAGFFGDYQYRVTIVRLVVYLIFYS